MQYASKISHEIQPSGNVLLALLVVLLMLRVLVNFPCCSSSFSSSSSWGANSD
ncbi:hypothetical protein PR003_g7472 [Phytophthora rubi]|uniref:Uncharacterized protein n=1 Tax=Phytophthora rubi TaxID=129364 RepID=A0A6A3MS51_9STRA|nr:hypothetical protein PR002_g7343 [Phytophthora rubi]KAE9346362.1 hypothetical protein PR003_g7472 [Phytophthora rubi]